MAHAWRSAFLALGAEIQKTDVSPSADELILLDFLVKPSAIGTEPALFALSVVAGTGLCFEIYLRLFSSWTAHRMFRSALAHLRHESKK